MSRTAIITALCLSLGILLSASDISYADTIAPKGYRSVPDVFEKTSSLDDNFYFNMGDNPESITVKLGKPLKTQKIDLSNFTAQYHTYGKKPVYDDSTGVLSMTCLTPAWSEWMQRCGVYLNLDFNDGDTAIIRVKIKSSLNDSSVAWSAADGALVYNNVASSYRYMYYPIELKHSYDESGNKTDNYTVNFYFGEKAQTISVKDAEILYYGNTKKITELPALKNTYDGYKSDAQWRTDANKRIEKERKGDINITVKRKDGTAVSGAEVKAEMLEHEFNFTAVVGLIKNSGTGRWNSALFTEKNYADTVRKYFNSLGTEGGFHRSSGYNTGDTELNDPKYSLDQRIIDWAGDNNTDKILKGHALMWDGGEPDITHEEFLDIIKNTTEENKNEKLNQLNSAVKKRIDNMIKLFPKVDDWDVTNEDSSRSAVVDGSSYTLKKWYGKWFDNPRGDGHDDGRELLIQWYDYARAAANKYSPSAKLTFNDNYSGDYKFDNYQLPYLKWAVDNLDFDNIGIQGHIGYNNNPIKEYERISKIAALGKPIRITEFDTGGIADDNGVVADENYQANIVRDMMTVWFSEPAVDTITLWGFTDPNSRHGRRILTYSDYTLKPSGRVYEDLVYNKWWTQTGGKTDAAGRYSCCGYYGTYKITVNANGLKSEKIVNLGKSDLRTVEFVLDEDNAKLSKEVTNTTDKPIAVRAYVCAYNKNILTNISMGEEITVNPGETKTIELDCSLRENIKYTEVKGFVLDNRLRPYGDTVIFQ